ncbi:MAG: hypothetical protein N3G20_11405 [Verrucomicrobiae bacterium]|nr:hypothetical protein [Verrucomicrobiae bacterium]
MDPVKVELLGIPGVLYLWVLAVAAFGVFAWRVSRLISLLRRGRYENRFDDPVRRVRHAIKHVLFQPRIFNERAIGIPHFLIFWGFVVYATCFNWNLVRGLLPFLPIPYPEEVGVIALLLEVFSVLVLVSLAVAAARRIFFPPPYLHLSIDANVILILIALLTFAERSERFRWLAIALAGDGAQNEPNAEPGAMTATSTITGPTTTDMTGSP